MQAKIFKGTVLLVTNHAAFKHGLQSALIQDGYGIRVAGNQEEGLHELQHVTPAILVVDRRESGFSQLHHAVPSSVPIITVTYHTAICDERHCALDIEDGATRSVCNASPAVLVALVGAVLRRLGWERPAPKHYAANGVTVDLENYEVKVGAKPIHMSATEFRILKSLVAAPGNYLTRKQLLDQVWGTGFAIYPHTLDVHMSSLRKKLNPDRRTPHLIQTIKGLGFRLQTISQPAESVSPIPSSHSMAFPIRPHAFIASRNASRAAGLSVFAAAHWRHRPARMGGSLTRPVVLGQRLPQGPRHATLEAPVPE